MFSRFLFFAFSVPNRADQRTAFTPNQTPRGSESRRHAPAPAGREQRHRKRGDSNFPPMGASPPTASGTSQDSGGLGRLHRLVRGLSVLEGNEAGQLGAIPEYMKAATAKARVSNPARKDDHFQRPDAAAFIAFPEISFLRIHGHSEFMGIRRRERKIWRPQAAAIFQRLIRRGELTRP